MKNKINRLSRLEHRQFSVCSPVRIIRKFVEAGPKGIIPVEAWVYEAGCKSEKRLLEPSPQETLAVFEARIANDALSKTKL